MPRVVRVRRARIRQLVGVLPISAQHALPRGARAPNRDHGATRRASRVEQRRAAWQKHAAQ
eukprot:42627-Prymnesium_polylepis.1